MTHKHPILFCLTIMMFFNPIYSAYLEILELNENPGIVAFKTNSVFIKEGSHTLFHRFNLFSFTVVLKQYESIILNIEENPKIAELVKILKQKQSQAYFILENLTARSRKTKRSLNFLGSTLKMITGNLDNEDLLKIENQLEILKNSNNLLVTENNEQIQINKLFEERINNITKQAYRQSREIDSIIKQTRLSLDRPVEWEHLLHLHNIIFNIDMINQQLSTIFEAIQLSKLGLISKAFLQPSELEFATNLLESQGVVINSYDQVYEFLEPIAFHNNSDIILLIKIPKFRQGEFVQLQIEAIPRQFKIIPINATKAIVGNNESYLISHPCMNIEHSIICDVQNLFNTSNDGCLHELLRGNTGNCTFIRSPMKPDTKEIENLGLLVKNSVDPTSMQNSCGYGPRNLTGTFLISFRDCSITLNGKTFTSKTFRGESRPVILPLHSVSVDESQTEPESIDYMEQLHIRNRHKLEHLETANKRTKVLNIVGIVLITCFVAVIFAFLTREVRKLKMKLTIRIPANNALESSQTILNRDGSN
uniref:Putative retrovirus-related env polyprotein from transposon gypsy n=1 Tax=Aedes albopictus TaxID=7160 RepID=A0A1W7R5L2_AEDAL